MTRNDYIKFYASYDDIPQDVFAETILDIAAEDINATLALPGIWEVISEAYNNDALDRLCPELRDED
jgi:hypothetical protein